MKNPLECHGTLTVAACGCIIESTINVPVERSDICKKPNHAPVKKPSYRKAADDKKEQVAFELKGSAVNDR